MQTTENQHIGFRLRAIIEYYGMNVRTFELKINAANGSIGKIIKSGSSIMSETLQRMSIEFPDLNIHWLITGEGDMIKANGNNIQIGVNHGTTHGTVGVSIIKESNNIQPAESQMVLELRYDLAMALKEIEYLKQKVADKEKVITLLEKLQA